MKIDTTTNRRGNGQKISGWELPSPLNLPRHASARILYAEDDAIISECFVDILTAAGYAVTATDDGLAARELLEQGGFDLLLTDNDMPGLTGTELVAQARLAGNNIPVILASGRAETFLDPDYEWLQIASLIQKPLGLADLLPAIELALLTRERFPRNTPALVAA